MSEIGFRPTSATDVIEMATKPLHKYSNRAYQYIFDVAFFNNAVGLRQFNQGILNPRKR